MTIFYTILAVFCIGLAIYSSDKINNTEFFGLLIIAGIIGLYGVTV